MKEDATFNLGRELAEILLGVRLQIALHLGMPEAAALRLRARLEVMVELWGAIYLAWLARRAAASPSRIRRYARPTARRPASRSASASASASARARLAPVPRPAVRHLPAPPPLAATLGHAPPIRPPGMATPVVRPRGLPRQGRGIARAGPPQKSVFGRFASARLNCSIIVIKKPADMPKPSATARFLRPAPEGAQSSLAPAQNGSTMSSTCWPQRGACTSVSWPRPP